MRHLEIIVGSCLDALSKIESETVQCCVTSPPYFGLRDYGHADQIGQEKTPEAFTTALVAVFHEVKRVLKDDGTLWLNLGDSYAGSGRSPSGESRIGGHSEKQGFHSPKVTIPAGLKPKDLIGIPWMVAFALRADGWYLRSDIIWAKQNCMPESVTDRPTRSHEYLFLLSKSAKYYYNHEAIKEPCIWDVDGTGTLARKARQNEDNKSMVTPERNGMRPAGFKDSKKFNGKNGEKQSGHSKRHAEFNDRWDKMTLREQWAGMKNKRDVWTIPPANYPEAHFATYPPDLVKPCILAGSKAGDTILDPFLGSGTTAMVALELGRNAIGIELNPEYAKLAEQRCNITHGLAL